MRPFVRRSAFLVAAAAALTLPLAPAPAAAQSGDPGAVYARMQRVNAGLRSFAATLHVDVTTHGFPYISPSLDGTAYFQSPDRAVVIFQTMPALADQFKKLYPQLEPPSTWPTIYDVTPVGDDGTSSQFRLVRKKNGRIDHVDVVADDKTATVTSMTYVYKDGGSITFSQTYALIEGNYLIQTQTGRIEIPHYSADVASTFSNYRLNVPIDAQVFATE